jgi:ppGpp synthetase/RelA/SpoT-type nucleotidyltranferase
MSDVAGLIREYQERLALYDAFAERASDELALALQQADLRVHSVTARVKQETSLSEKLQRPEAGYEQLSAVKDIVGVRVITYFAEDAHVAAGILRSRFVVDETYSVDKSTLLDPDRFGYVSLHFVAGLGEDILCRPGDERFRGCLAEVQIRSLLQHAWAEIEHDLGYKSAHAVPRGIRRRFSRLAGLLELADSEFEEIRRELSGYQNAVTERIAQEPGEVAINQLSLIAFVRTSPAVAELEALIGVGTRYAVRWDERFLAGRVEELLALGIRTVSMLDAAIQRERSKIVELGRQLLVRAERVELPRGICVLHLEYVLAAREGEDRALRFLERFRIGKAADRRGLARQLSRWA